MVFGKTNVVKVHSSCCLVGDHRHHWSCLVGDHRHHWSCLVGDHRHHCSCLVGDHRHHWSCPNTAAATPSAAGTLEQRLWWGQRHDRNSTEEDETRKRLIVDFLRPVNHDGYSREGNTFCQKIIHAKNVYMLHLVHGQLKRRVKVGKESYPKCNKNL